MKKSVALIGAPTDIGAGARGVSMGPEAFRVANLADALRDCGFVVNDCGNLVGPANPNTAAQGGYRHLPEVTAWNKAVKQAVSDQLQKGQIPILMGGDHCLAIGSISAVMQHCALQQKRLLVLWFDAHTDFNTVALTPSGNIHGMPVACLFGFGPKDLTDLVPANFLHVNQLVQIGIRSVDTGERRFVQEQGLEVFDMRSIDELGMRAVMQKALSNIDSKIHIHVSFDIDFLDPSFAPGVGTRVMGGPTYREAQLCMEMIADTSLLGSVDVVELNPALDTCNQSAQVTVELMQSLFGKSTLARIR